MRPMELPLIRVQTKKILIAMVVKVDIPFKKNIVLFSFVVKLEVYKHICVEISTN